MFVCTVAPASTFRCRCALQAKLAACQRPSHAVTTCSGSPVNWPSDPGGHRFHASASLADHMLPLRVELPIGSGISTHVSLGYFRMPGRRTCSSQRQVTACKSRVSAVQVAWTSLRLDKAHENSSGWTQQWLGTRQLSPLLPPAAGQADRAKVAPAQVHLNHSTHPLHICNSHLSGGPWHATGSIWSLLSCELQCCCPCIECIEDALLIGWGTATLWKTCPADLHGICQSAVAASIASYQNPETYLCGENGVHAEEGQLLELCLQAP